ncbi:hypothetical protein DES53_102406 [Roseimicrobium gellanilyticum]|uniref:Uncharacterized protein n=1 Tax=Roseimicrobium gellanilyticum TaxID=748857 RepID=A0A366HQT3_9BACT|nr:hypothetical protein DES53_102406 [Roseimicrobium gellanilyticum]
MHATEAPGGNTKGFAFPAKPFAQMSDVRRGKAARYASLISSPVFEFASSTCSRM